MAPFGFTWLTFSAFIVTGLAVVAAILWAVFTRSKKEDDDV
jgi:hypothetical protein